MSSLDENETELRYHQPTSDKIKRFFQLMEEDGDGAKQYDDISRVPDAQSHELLTTPLFSSSSRQHLIDSHSEPSQTNEYEPFAQYGLLGMALWQNKTGHGGFSQPGEANVALERDLIFTNMNAPWSTFLCGSQGAGKSHTLSCLLENALLSSSPNSNVTQPMTGIIFHYDKFSGFTQSQLCEAAYLCSKVQDVRVLVASTSELRMQRLYGNLPGLPKGSSKPRVMPLYFQERHIDLSNIIQLMAVNDTQQGSPLYLEVIFDILRNMAKRNQNHQGINFREFESALLMQEFNPAQKSFQNMRMNLLRSFLDPRVTGDTSIVPPDFDRTWTFPPGSLTIVDLSDPFVTADDACALFSICLSIFMSNCHRSAKVVALDEAHKFLTQAGEASKFTEDLLQIIRQQRHLGTRVIIATQEPTLSPKLLELSSISVIHRFSSPAWFNVLREHLAGVKASDRKHQDLFTEILSLGTGEALVFCPSALVSVVEDAVMPLKDNFMKVRIRKRITTDGGKSIMASDTFTEGTGSPFLVEQPNHSFGVPIQELQVPELELSKLVLADHHSSHQAQPFGLNTKPTSGKFATARPAVKPEPQSSSSSTLECLSEQSDSADSESGAVIKPSTKVTRSQSVASHTKPTESRQPTPQLRPSQPKKSEAAKTPAPKPTEIQISNAFRRIVKAHLIEHFKNPNPGSQFRKWRIECALKLGLPENFFTSKQRKKESTEILKRTVVNFYVGRALKLPREAENW